MRHRSLLLIVFLVVFVDLLGFGIVLPLMPVYAKQFTAGMSTGQQVLILSSLMTSFSIMQLIFAPFWGRISDRWGRRPVLLVSLSGSTSFYFLFGLATLKGSLFWMFVSRIGAGIAGGTIPTAQACIADATPPDKRARGMALIGAAFGLGFTLGPLLGALALLTAGNAGLSPWPGYTASIFSSIALGLAIFVLPESLDPQAIAETRRHFGLAAVRQALAVPSIGLLLGAGFLAVFALANFEATISWTVAGMLGVERSSAQILTFFAYIGLVQTLVQGFLVRRLAGRLGEATLVAIGGLLSILGYVLLAWAADPRYVALAKVELASAAVDSGFWAMLRESLTTCWRVGLASAVVVSGFGFLQPAFQSLLSRRTDPAKQGGILGVGESTSAMARITGNMAGVAFYFTAVTLPFWMAAAVMALCLASAWIAVARGRDWAQAVGASTRAEAQRRKEEAALQ